MTIIPVDDSLPLVTSHVLKVQEGIRKMITEFELKAVDEDTRVSLSSLHFCQFAALSRLGILLE